MIAEDRECVDVLQQIASVHEALRGVGKLMMQKYVESCASEGIRSGTRASCPWVPPPESCPCADLIRSERIRQSVRVLAEHHSGQ